MQQFSENLPHPLSLCGSSVCLEALLNPPRAAAVNRRRRRRKLLSFLLVWTSTTGERSNPQLARSSSTAATRPYDHLQQSLENTEILNEIEQMKNDEIM